MKYLFFQLIEFVESSDFYKEERRRKESDKI